MRVLLLVPLVVACGEKPEPMPPKRPNNELIVGDFERHPPAGTTAARFRGDGSIIVAHEAADLDRKSLAEGTWTLEGDKLTLTYAKGEMCEAGVAGTYQVVLSRVGIRFKKLEDTCDRRAKMDGETWYRTTPPPGAGPKPKP